MHLGHMEIKNICRNAKMFGKIPIQADTLEIWKNKTIEYFNAHKKKSMTLL